MEFFKQGVDVFSMIITGLGAGVGVMGLIGLLEGYSEDNPARKSAGGKQLIAGGGMALVGRILIPVLANVFTV